MKTVVLVCQVCQTKVDSPDERTWTLRALGKVLCADHSGFGVPLVTAYWTVRFNYEPDEGEALEALP